MYTRYGRATRHIPSYSMSHCCMLPLDHSTNSKSRKVCKLPFHSLFGPTSGVTSINMRRDYALQHAASSMQHAAMQKAVSASQLAICGSLHLSPKPPKPFRL